jgi:hypothetical protein
VNEATGTAYISDHTSDSVTVLPAPATLSAASVALSNPTAGATSSYAWQFTPATAAEITKVELTLPPTSSATGAALGPVFGLGAGTLSITGNLVTYTLTAAQSVPTGEPIYVAIRGITNGSSPATKSSGVFTFDASGIVDGGRAPTNGSYTPIPPETTVHLTASDGGVILDTPATVGTTTASVTVKVDSDASSVALGLKASATGGPIAMSGSGSTLPAGDWAIASTGGTTLGNAADTVTANDATSGTWYGPPGSTSLALISVSAPSGQTLSGFSDTVRIGVASSYSTPPGTSTITLTFSLSPLY